VVGTSVATFSLDISHIAILGGKSLVKLYPWKWEI
jgi:hypothetical protein